MHGENNNIIFLDNCSVIEKELICKIGKDIIEEYTAYNGEKYSIYFYRPGGKQSRVEGKINSISGIYINYPISKKDIKVEITKLNENKIDVNNYIAYETNVKDITNENSKKFLLEFSNNNYFECFLRKTEGLIKEENSI